ncbi:MAG: hypothetical protein QM813_18425 [Verrucomicrobiota bacterium]
MMRLRLCVAIYFAITLSALAQLGGPASTGVSASLIRLFGTNNAFTAQAEVQVLDKNSKELISTPMSFALTDGRIRVEVDVNRMRNKMEPDALAKVKPLGMDNVVSIIRPEQKAALIVFPKLSAFVKLDMPPNEAQAFLTRAKIERTTLGKEKMEGHPSVKQRVVITDDSGKKSEATVWTATDLRDFPVCVATREQEGTVVVRFRQIQFARAAADRFEPPPSFTECSDIQTLLAGPVVKYMKEKGTTVKSAAPKPVPKSASKPAPKKN